MQLIVQNNLECLLRILQYNLKHGILFFRISSDLIPFASHPVCEFPWQRHFQKSFKEIGQFIKKNHMRISMHPDQFIVINSPRDDVVQRSIAELTYHAQILDLMGLDTSAKIQLHVGGVYRDYSQSIKRFIDRFKSLDSSIKRRLVIENDDKSYSVQDCLQIHNKTNIPILFDYFHHSLKNNNEPLVKILEECKKTWNPHDGIPMVDYSSSGFKNSKGAHAEHLNLSDFKYFLQQSNPYDFDLMLEIKDKERSALKALIVVKYDQRFVDPHKRRYNYE
jgi:UV DNA damage endonuclease